MTTIINTSLGDLLEKLRDNLRPKGTADVVRIGGVFFDSELVAQAINTIEAKLTTFNLDGGVDTLNPLELICMTLLVDTAGV